MEVWIAEHHIEYEGFTILGIFHERKDAQKLVVNSMDKKYYRDAAIDEISTTYYMSHGDKYIVQKYEVK